MVQHHLCMYAQLYTSLSLVMHGMQSLYCIPTCCHASFNLATTQQQTNNNP